MDQDIVTLRKEIDELDNLIVDTINKRVQLAKRTIERKKELGLSVYDAEREESIIKRLQSRVDTSLKDKIAVIYECIMLGKN